MKNISFCGLDCRMCEAYSATMDNDLQKIVVLSKNWSNGNFEFKPQDIWCEGCHQDGTRLFKWCRECPMRQCGIEKNIESCAQCADFPCEIINNAPPEVKTRLTSLL